MLLPLFLDCTNRRSSFERRYSPSSGTSATATCSKRRGGSFVNVLVSMRNAPPANKYYALSPPFPLLVSAITAPTAVSYSS